MCVKNCFELKGREFMGVFLNMCVRERQCVNKSERERERESIQILYNVIVKFDGHISRLGRRFFSIQFFQFFSPAETVIQCQFCLFTVAVRCVYEQEREK